MVRVDLAAAAVEDLDRLIVTLTLPADTRSRVRRSLEILQRVPLLGPELTGRWSGLRFLLGPWRWMILVYRYDADSDVVTVLAIQDARSGTSPRSTDP